MSPAPADVVDFLGAQPPFDLLPPDALGTTAGALHSLYVCADNVAELFDGAAPALYVVRSAVLDVGGDGETPAARLESGDFYGHEALLRPDGGLAPPRVARDGIVYRLDAAQFDTLCTRHPDFSQYFRELAAGRELYQRRGSGAGADWVDRRVGTLATRAAVTASATDTVETAARRMREIGISCLPVLDGDALCGIVTDRDLRNRVLAAGLPAATGLQRIMTPDPVTVHVDDALFDAVERMSRHNVHHLPVVDAAGRLRSVLTTSDLVREQRIDPVLVVGRLHRATTPAGLADEAMAIAPLVRGLAARTGSAQRVSQLLASLTDTMTVRLIELWEAEHGPAPASYAWIAFGSHARRDQHLHSDQDSGLLLAEDVRDDPWFSGLAGQVRDGLAQCGIAPCPGGMMAANREWRLSLDGWQRRFERWTSEPSPDGVMHAMICFDSRCIAGDAALFQRHREAVARTGRNGLFLAHAARRVADVAVPIGLFDRLRGRRANDGARGIDIKRNAIAVVNDIARLHALAAGLTVADTPTRLATLADTGVIAPADARDLTDSWRFLTDLRLKHQLDAADADDPNLLDPQRLGTLRRRQLKAAFRIVKTSQRALALSFRGGG